MMGEAIREANADEARDAASELRNPPARWQDNATEALRDSWHASIHLFSDEHLTRFVAAAERELRSRTGVARDAMTAEERAANPLVAGLLDADRMLGGGA